MKCKYPETSRMYKACVICNEKSMCPDNTAKLPSAQEAYDKTNKNAINNAAVELKNITEDIRKAITDGKYYISQDGTLSKTAKEMLENQGYKVETGYQYNQSYYTISWDKDR